MITITVKPEVEQALRLAFPQPQTSAARALAKYVQTLEQLVRQAMLYGQDPAQRKLGIYAISLQRLANLGGQIGPERVRVHAWLREQGLELVRTVTQGSNLTGRLSEVKLTELVMCEDLPIEEQIERERLGDSDRFNAATSPDDYDGIEVNEASLRSYISWLTEQATLIPQAEKQQVLRHAQMILASARSSNGIYYQHKKPSVFGRIYYEGISIQNVNKELRRAILGDCWEYDIRSSVIAWKMGFAQSYLASQNTSQSIREVFPATANYMEDKADFMRTVRHFIFLDGTNVPKDLQSKLLKQAITAISFGARATSTGWLNSAGAWTNPALVDIIKNPEERSRFLGDMTIRAFIREQNNLDNFIFGQFKQEAPELLEASYLQTPSGRVSKSKVLAFYYQHSETLVMNALCASASRHGHEAIARVHDAVFFRKRLGPELKSQLELAMRDETSNPYWSLAASELTAYRTVSKDVLAEEAAHRVRIAQEELSAVGYSASRQPDRR